MKPSGSHFPILRVLAGILLVLAGIFAFYGIGFGPLGALIVVFGGAVLVVAVLVGHRPRPWDIAFVIVAILVLSGVTSGGGYGRVLSNYSATMSQVHVSAFSLTASAGIGSLDVSFSDKPGLAYQVNFSRTFPLFWPSGGESVTNSTGGGVFNLDVQSSSAAVTVVLGRSFTAVDLDLSADTGSVSLEATGNEPLGTVLLSSSTGSVSAVVDTSTLKSLELRTSTGSVSLVSHSLGTSSGSVPVTLSTSTGSVSMSATIQAGDAVSLTGSTNLGSVEHSLTGFTITQDKQTSLAATAGPSGGARGSFVISGTSNLGTVSFSVVATS